MRRITIALALLLSACEDAEPSAGEGPTCSEVREDIVLACEAAAAEAEECQRPEVEEGVTVDCRAEIDARNDCVALAMADAESASDPNVVKVARDLAYFCDLLGDEWMCEMIEEDAPSKGVTECPLPERF